MSTPFAYPASVQQQGLYRLHLRHPGLVAYNLGIEQVLVGPVDAGVLERVFNEMVRRHESLRTGFTLRDDAVMQLVAPSAEVPLALTDLSGLPAGEREPALRTLQLDDARTPFDLERGPLLRTRLVRLGPDRHVLVLVINHLVFDAHSMFLVLREFSQLYPAFLAGRPSPLPPLRIQYVDFCAWQARRLAGAAVTRQLDYWRRQLPGSPGLRLPVDRPWPDELSLEGGRLPVELPPGLTTSIRSVARQEGATPYMVVLACYQALLREITGQDDVTVRSPVVGRDRPELEHLIGFFVNRVVMRTDLSGDPTFRQLLARVKAVVLAAFANQDVPFEKLLQELPPAPPGPPPFQVGLNLIPGHGAGGRTRSCRSRSSPASSTTTAPPSSR